MKIILLFVVAFAVFASGDQECGDGDVLNCVYCSGANCDGVEPTPCDLGFCVGGFRKSDDGKLTYKYCMNKIRAKRMCNNLRKFADEIEEGLCYICNTDKCNAQNEAPPDAVRVEKYP